ncbi:MAG: hypothetical protein EP329_24115 [Deltaproteobacteria bacterium]|nr:MAG: hypothetical protein EP329_24115 [Deltaproteobacteria bacterium]
MRLFTSKGYHLSSLSPLAKLVYSLFLVFTAVGLWTSWEIYATRIGGSLDGPSGTPSVAERYVAGSRADEATTSSDGPALDLPPEPGMEAAGAPVEDVKGPWILDVFHQHTFSVSVVFLILAHLFMLTRLHAVTAGVVIGVAGVSALAHVLAPPLIHASDGGWLWLMPVSGALMGVSWTAMVLWSALAMWFRVGARQGSRPNGAAADAS